MCAVLEQFVSVPRCRSDGKFWETREIAFVRLKAVKHVLAGYKILFAIRQFIKLKYITLVVI
jgi:hypothetical protein